MNEQLREKIACAKQAAIEVLVYNSRGPFDGLPRTAGWGYPEPYTRDLMISSLGILLTDNEQLHDGVRKSLETLASNQSRLGHIPSLVHDSEDRGASDTTPLFLIALACYRKVAGEEKFLESAAEKALTWMEYQSPADRVLVGQLPTTDWRDEQWVLGYGLFVNSLVYCFLRLYGQEKRAKELCRKMRHFTITQERQNRHVHEGLRLKEKPYYAFWSFKVYNNERFDLLGNSLAVLNGIAPASRGRGIIDWIEGECEAMRGSGELGIGLSPNFFPYTRPEDPDWRMRDEIYNKPGEYHNGGVWPFVCGFHIAAMVAAGKMDLAQKHLAALTDAVKLRRVADVEYGFNEWLKAQDGTARGQDWQSWSAAMYIYAAECVERGSTPFFDAVRSGDSG